MSARRDLVFYTRIFKKGPLTPAAKERLKKQINDIIDGAANTIALEVMVNEPRPKKRKRKK
jgi:hypothetical protein